MRLQNAPLSAFARQAWLPHATSWNEYRNVAREIPLWDAKKCIACGKCAVYCPHGAIRPYLLSDAEFTEFLKHAKITTASALRIAGMNYVIQEAPRDCTGCYICAKHCPTGALRMTRNTSKLNVHEQSLFDFVEQVQKEAGYNERLPVGTGFTERELYFKNYTLKCHSACPGCGESNYIELMCKVVLETLKQPLSIIQGTGCPLVYLGEHGSQPLAAKNIFWTNSLFEDTAEVAFGMAFAAKRPVWAVMGDGAAYDIDFNGVDFVARNRAPVKIMVLDNHGYANTGGQKSSATPILTKAKLGQNCCYKDLGRLLMYYENAYVATVSGHDARRTAEVLRRAHEFPGPAIVIAYAPCMQHGGGRLDAVEQQKRAVASGLHILYEYDPRRPRGKRLVLESAKSASVVEMHEKRFLAPEALDKQLEERLQTYRSLSEVL